MLDLHIELIHQRDHDYRLKMSLYRPDQDAPLNPLETARPIITLDPAECPDPLQGGDPGRWLGQQLLADSAASTGWEWALGASGGQLLRLRLELDDELHRFPWEALILPHVGQVALSERILLSRFMFVSRQEAVPALTAGRIKLITAVAAPTDIEDYGLARPNRAAFQEPIAALLASAEGERSPQAPIRAGRVSLEAVPATLTALNDALRAGCDILYLAGHGAIGSEGAVIYLEDEAGQTAPITATEFLESWQNLDRLPRLVILVSCQSAGADTAEDPLQSLGAQLVALGVPAVLAMLGNILIETAQTLLPPFFASLLADGVIDRALAVGRQAIADRPDAIAPVLFMRLNSGQLFSQDYVLDIIDRFRAHDDYALFSNGKYYDLPVDVLTVEADQMLSQLDRSGSTETGARDLNQVFDGYFARQRPRRPELLVLVGAYGTNRTTQLRQIVWHALEQRQPDLLPLYIDLSDYAKVRRNTREALLQLMLRALQAARPALSRAELRELLREGPRFRLLFDRGESLAEAERQRAWTEILLFAQNHPRHDLAVSAMPDSELDFLEQFAEVAVIRLYIQPLAIRKLRRFLKHGTFPADLFERIRRARLTDLATLPYFMVRILRQVEFDDLADSRAAFMQQLLDDAVLKMGSNTGMAPHVLPFLKALAWRTRVEALTEISVDDAYDLAAQIRGSREYSLEQFIQGLVDAWILSKAGNNRLLFSNQQIEAFCCALALRDRPDWQAAVEDIVVTLGNEVRRRRWEESLVFLAALLAEEPEAFKALLFKIIYGVSLFESDVVFLVARCLMQRRAYDTTGHEQIHDLSFIHELERQLVNALQWRLDPQHESQTERAERATALLGELAYLDPAGVVPVLAAVANQRVRVDSKGKRDFHYSHVRFTALVALEQLWESVDSSLEIKANEEESLYDALAALEAAMLEHVAQNDTALYTLLEAWSEPVDTSALMKLFQDHVAVTEAETERSQRDVAGLAAMALGDLASKKRDEAEAAAIVRFLQGQFFALAPRKQDFTLWALTHGLAMCPEDLVHDFVVQPFVQSDKRRAEGAGDKGAKDGRMGYGLLQRHKYMTYLIGRLRLRDEESYRFLCDECLQINNMHLWIAVIDALGWITTEALEQRKQRLGLLEDLAAGAIQKHMPEFSFSEREQLYLRQRALAVLAESGDEATLARLQNVDLGQSTTAGDPFPSVLLPQLHRTRQQILLRLEARRLARSQQEVRHE